MLTKKATDFILFISFGRPSFTLFAPRSEQLQVWGLLEAKVHNGWGWGGEIH